LLFNHVVTCPEKRSSALKHIALGAFFITAQANQKPSALAH